MSEVTVRSLERRLENCREQYERDQLTAAREIRELQDERDALAARVGELEAANEQAQREATAVAVASEGEEVSEPRANPTDAETAVTSPGGLGTAARERQDFGSLTSPAFTGESLSDSPPDLASRLAAAEAAAARATTERDEARQVIPVVMAVHAEVTTRLLGEYIAAWKDTGEALPTPSAEYIARALTEALPVAVAKGIPDTIAMEARATEAEARAARLTEALREIADVPYQREDDPRYTVEVARAALAAVPGEPNEPGKDLGDTA